MVGHARSSNLKFVAEKLVDENAMVSLEALADSAQVALKVPHRQLVFIGD